MGGREEREEEHRKSHTSEIITKLGSRYFRCSSLTTCMGVIRDNMDRI